MKWQSLPPTASSSILRRGWRPFTLVVRLPFQVSVDLARARTAEATLGAFPASLNQHTSLVCVSW